MRIVYGDGHRYTETKYGVSYESYGSEATVYYKDGETLPFEGILQGSVAINTDKHEIAFFNGTQWILKHADGTIEKIHPNANIFEIANKQFFKNTALADVEYPDVKTVGMQAFAGCPNLKIVDFAAVEKLGMACFQECPNLKAVIIRGDTVCTMATNSFGTGVANGGSTPIAGGDGYIYVPSKNLSTYQGNARNYNYENNFRALESYTVDGTVTGALDWNKINATA